MLGILIPEFPTQTHIFFWREIAEMRRKGVQVRVISTRRPPESACRHEFAAAARAETHYVYPPDWRRAAATLAADPAGAARALAYLAALGETPARERPRHLGLLACAADLLAYARREGIRHLHAHSCADAAHVVALCRALGGPPYSLMLHGDLAVYGPNQARKMAGAACVTCAGPHLVRQIVEGAGYPAERVMSNWMGFDTSRFRPPGRRRATAGALRLLTVARLDACKGHRHALAAVRAAVDAGADVEYTIVGEGSERAAIEADVARLGLADRVRLLGTCGEAQVLAELHRADAFVLPSVGLGEAQGVAMAEAMACGLPVVCSVIGAIDLIVRDGVDGHLVAQGDEAAIARALLHLAGDPEARLRMGDAARARAAALFDVRDTTARSLRFYEASAGVALWPRGEEGAPDPAPGAAAPEVAVA